eukprot:3033866-Rhodomonas_salina.1
MAQQPGHVVSSKFTKPAQAGSAFPSLNLKPLATWKQPSSRLLGLGEPERAVALCIAACQGTAVLGEWHPESLD